MKTKKQIEDRIDTIEVFIKQFNNIGDRKQVDNLENVKIALRWVLA
jgi:hypothetical protein